MTNHPTTHALPEGWTSRRLGDVAHIKTGDRDNQDKVDSGRYPLFVRSSTVERIDTYSYDGEAILVPGEGGIGEIFHYISGPFDWHQRVYKISDFPEDVDGRYVYYQMRYRFGAQAKRHSVKATVDSLRLPTFTSFELPVPPHGEQRAIAEVLTDIDDAIDATDALITKKRDVKTAVMQQLLTGQTRLPGFTHEWTTQCLGELARLSSGGTPPVGAARYFDGGIPWVAISDMTDVKYLHKSARTLSAAGLSHSAARLYRPGTVLYAMYASIGACSIAPGEVSSSQAILGIEVGDQLDGEFLYYHLQSIRERVRRLGQQGTQANLNAGMVRSFQIPLPPIAEQRAIAEVLTDMDDEIAALEAERDKLELVKVGMMQELLTGRTRLV